MTKQDSSLKSFIYKDEVFFYIKKRIKTLRLRFDQKGQAILSIPYACNFCSVYNFLDSSKKWRIKTKQRLEQDFLKENELVFLAKKYRVMFDTRVKKTHFNKDTVLSPSKKSLDLFLKQNAKKIFSFYLKKWSKKTNLFYTHLSIKTMKTRWGSCNPNKAYINLNLKLLQKNLKAIEYVILHELSHIKFAKHSKEFYAFIEYFMSDFRLREQEFLS